MYNLIMNWKYIMCAILVIWIVNIILFLNLDYMDALKKQVLRLQLW